MAKPNARLAAQYAALPWRIGTGGKREVMLLTSRETHRWVIPKGWPMSGKKPAEVARQEAFEEAGLIGQMSGKRPLGRYQYLKRLKQGSTRCEVTVYLLQVEQQLDDWPEKDERTTRWFDANEAATLVDERGLSEIIEGFAGSRRRLVVYGKRRKQVQNFDKSIPVAD
jgi:8-oxo-dGTP pyrophosphatase MutT (NUDIX family)